jgi:hypothetical protein
VLNAPRERASGSGDPGCSCAHTPDLWAGATARGLREDGFLAGVGRIKWLRKKLGPALYTGASVYDHHGSNHPAARRPNEAWVTDLTYVLTTEGGLYLAGIKDLYICEGVGHAMGGPDDDGIGESGPGQRLRPCADGKFLGHTEERTSESPAI